MATWNGFPLITVPTTVTVYGEAGAPRSIEWNDTDIAGATTNPFTAQQQIYNWGQGYMEFSFSYPAMPVSVFRQWQVFLRLLEGINGVFLSAADPLASAPQNSLATAPTVSGVNAAGSYSLNISGGSHNTVGDWFSIPGNGAFSTGSRLYQITAISGSVWSIWPPIREATAGGETLTINGAKGVWRLKNTGRRYSCDVQRVYQLAYEAREAL